MKLSPEINLLNLKKHYLNYNEKFRNYIKNFRKTI